MIRITEAVAIFNGPIYGSVTFKENRNSSWVTVKFDLVGFKKEGKIGCHVHEMGIIKSNIPTRFSNSVSTKYTCMDAKGHFDPVNILKGSNYIKHGPRITNQGQSRHVGDLGNITVKKYGREYYCREIFRDPYIKLNGINSIIGRSLMIHEKEDDLGMGGLICYDGNLYIDNKKIHKESQLTGNAGGRMSCSIIGIKKNKVILN
jgi:Cu-Zn family superoxide dismutase